MHGCSYNVHLPRRRGGEGAEEVSAFLQRLALEAKTEQSSAAGQTCKISLLLACCLPHHAGFQLYTAISFCCH